MLPAFCFVLSLILFPGYLLSAELRVTNEKDTASCQYSLQLDTAEKLAGVKIALDYPDSIKYDTADKGSQFNSFLHVVNDKNPGKIILVMASAKGVSGKDVTLFSLRFHVATKEQPEECENLVIRTCQLMSDSLVEIPCTWKKGP